MSAWPGADADDAAAENTGRRNNTTARPSLRPTDITFPDSSSRPYSAATTARPSSSTPTPGSSASIKYLLTYADGKTIKFTELNLNASFTSIGQVPAIPLTPCALVNPEDQSQTPQDKDSSA